MSKNEISVCRRTCDLEAGCKLPNIMPKPILLFMLNSGSEQQQLDTGRSPRLLVGNNSYGSSVRVPSL